MQQLTNSASLCMTHAIPAVVRMKRWGEIQPALVANLSSSDLNRARWAAESLAKFGDAKAERPMWERLRQLHERWASRKNEFAGYRPGASREVMEAVGVQYGLVQSIAVAQNWTLTDEQLDELATLALGSERENIKQYRWNSPVDVILNILFDGKMRADINQYHTDSISALTDKLANFPAGTRFRLTAFGEESRIQATLQQINEAAVQSRVNVEIMH